jgi:transcription elongation factor GreA
VTLSLVNHKNIEIVDLSGYLVYNITHIDTAKGSKALTNAGIKKEKSIMPEGILLTKEGYEKVTAELEELITVKRKEVAERIKEAISYGDISENSEYDSAKNEQAELEERINKLENMVRVAKIIDGNNISSDSVNIGLKVKVKNLTSKNKDVTEFSIVGSAEAEPFEGKISNESLVGRALIGKKVKDKVEIQIPDGVVKYEILEIRK